MSDTYHVPVLLQECLEGLQINPKGIYVDVTFGGGGHSIEIVKKLSEEGHLYAFDQDADAAGEAQKIQSRSFTFIASNFRYLEKYLRFYKVDKVDGILADLGVSSHQIDEPGRGFSFRGAGDLDMRMNTSTGTDALTFLNEASDEELAKALYMYGELKNSRFITRLIRQALINGTLKSTVDLKNALSKAAPRGKENKFYAQVFQAIRIAVNDEMGALRDFLQQAEQVLKPGGRLVVMSYHSLEDRLVKNFMRYGNFEGKPEKDMYGNLIRPMEPVNRKPIVAGGDEIERNKRARSAKLRVAEKL